MVWPEPLALRCAVSCSQQHNPHLTTTACLNYYNHLIKARHNKLLTTCLLNNSSNLYIGVKQIQTRVLFCRCTFEKLPMISVAREYVPNSFGTTFKWFSADNRRLWVAKHLERLGKLDRIQVNVVRGIPLQKMTTKNGGVSIRVRGDPRGCWHSKPGAAWPERDGTASRRTSGDHYKVCICLTCFNFQ